MTDFVAVLEQTPESERDGVIRNRILKGNLPTFGHPEIAAAGRENHLEMDPSPALYLAPLFEAIEKGTVVVSPNVQKRAALLERIYQIALAIGLVTMLPFVVLQAAGFIMLARALPWAALLAFGLLAYFLMLTGPVTGPKYRLPIEPVLLVLTALPLARFIERRVTL